MLEKGPSSFSIEDGFQKAQTAPREGGVETGAAVQERVMTAWPWMIAVEMKKCQHIGELKFKSPGLNNTRTSYTAET